MKNFNDFLKDQLADEEVRREFNNLDPAFSLARNVIRLRKKRGLSQKQLAEKISSTQAVVSRIENGAVNCSLSTIQKISQALGGKLSIEIVADEIVPYFEEKAAEPELVINNVARIVERPSSCANLTGFLATEFEPETKSTWEHGKNQEVFINGFTSRYQREKKVTA